MNNSLPDFLLIPIILIQDKTLRPTDLLVYGAIYWYTRLKMERCIASNKTLADVANCDYESVRQGLRRLKNAGYIEVRLDSDNRREEIIPLVAFKYTPGTNEPGGGTNEPGGVVQMNQAPGSNEPHNKNIKEEDKKNILPIVPQGLTKANETQSYNKTAENKRLLSLQAQNVFSCWSVAGPIKHASLNEKMEAQILKRFKEGYTTEQINSAIVNYSEILHNQDSFFKYKWTLAEFVSRGLEKFLDRDIALSNFVRKQAGGAISVE